MHPASRGVVQHWRREGWKSQALPSGGCVGSLGAASQLGAVAAVPGRPSPPGSSAELPVLCSPAALQKGGQG